MPRVPRFNSLCLYRMGAYELLNKLVNSNKRCLKFSEIYEDIYKTPAVLTHRLKELERVGLIRRIVNANPGESISIRYEITEYGKEALAIFNELERKVTEAKSHI